MDHEVGGGTPLRGYPPNSLHGVSGHFCCVQRWGGYPFLGGTPPTNYTRVPAHCRCHELGGVPLPGRHPPNVAQSMATLELRPAKNQMR